MNPDSGHVVCSHCLWSCKETIGRPCTDLLGDVANQSLCLQFQGWTQGKTNWRCPDCTILYCSGPRQISAQLLRCRHGQLADSVASPCMDVPSPPAPPPPHEHADASLSHCTSPACLGCLQVCLHCRPFCVAMPSPSFVDRLRGLTIILNSLPTSCMPEFLLNVGMNERAIRVCASLLPDSMDHGNLSGSALMLAC